MHYIPHTGRIKSTLVFFAFEVDAVVAPWTKTKDLSNLKGPVSLLGPQQRAPKKANAWVAIIVDGPDLQKDIRRAKVQDAVAVVIRSTDPEMQADASFDLPAVYIDETDGQELIKTPLHRLKDWTARQREDEIMLNIQSEGVAEPNLIKAMSGGGTVDATTTRCFFDVAQKGEPHAHEKGVKSHVLCGPRFVSSVCRRHLFHSSSQEQSCLHTSLFVVLEVLGQNHAM